MTMRLEEHIGARIRHRRTQLGLTGEQLGVRLEHYTGHPWSRHLIYQAESGRRAFPAAELIAFALALGTAIDDLLASPPDVVTLADGVEASAAQLQTVTDVEGAINRAEQQYRSALAKVASSALIGVIEGAARVYNLSPREVARIAGGVADELERDLHEQQEEEDADDGA